MKIIKVIGACILLVSLSACESNSYIAVVKKDVKSHLNNPNTAVFNDIKVSHFNGDTDENYMRITGHVQTKNKSGVSSTSSFDCTVSKTNEYYYSVIDDNVVEGTDIPPVDD